MCSCRQKIFFVVHLLCRATKNSSHSLNRDGNEAISSGSASTIGTKTRYIIGHVLQGHGALGLGMSRPEWNKETSTQKKAGSDSITAKETGRRARATSEAKCRQRLMWDEVETKMVSWKLNGCSFQEKCKIKLRGIRVEIIAGKITQRPSYSLDLPKHAQNTKFLSKQLSLMKQWMPFLFPDAVVFDFFLSVTFCAAEQVTACKIFPQPHFPLFLNYWNGCFISEQAICSINPWLAVKKTLSEVLSWGQEDLLNWDC